MADVPLAGTEILSKYAGSGLSWRLCPEWAEGRIRRLERKPLQI
jgi:hypothetical protein